MYKKVDLVIMKGLPASGKTTAAKEMVKASNGTLKRVNKDDIRSMIDSKFSREREKNVISTRDRLIELYLSQGYSVVVDDTNLHHKHEINLTNMFSSKANIIVDDSFLDVPLETCLLRDSQRSNPVGRKVIEGMYTQFIVGLHGYTYMPNSNLPTAFIFDIDGTLATMKGRHPFEWDKVMEDEPVWPVVEILRATVESGHEVVILSGRDGSCREDTKKWLDHYKIPYSKLFMRAKGCQRKDSDIKLELFQNYVINNYNILGVFDDRDQVVNVWRKIGLICFQCNYGAF